MELFEATGVRKHFVGVTALREAFLHVRRGQVCGLVGANGSGKSTFSKICAGVLRADQCTIAIDGKPVHISNTKDADAFGISLVHQNLSLAPDLAVWENIVLGKENTRASVFVDSRKDRAHAWDVLNDLLPDQIPLDEKVSALSPGQKMIVEIAKAISRSPELLILDEPSAALEYKQVDHLFAKIEDLKKKGVLMVFISHRIWEVTRICDTVFAFRNGETVGEIDFSRQQRDERLILPLVAGEEGLQSSFEKKVTNGSLDASVVSVRADNVSLKSRLRSVSFEARRGEILGIGGLHGQGQVELIRVLAGAVRPTEGKVFLNGTQVKGRGVSHAIAHGMYFVPGDRQQDGLFMQKDVFFNTVMPRFPLHKDGFIPSLRRLAEVTRSVIERISLNPPLPRMVVNNLSGGNQQKVVFGRWLQFAPEVLLLDDPAKGVDIGAMHYLYRLVGELAANGTTVILYASSNEELISNCDRVLIMFEGRFVKELKGDELTDENLVKHSLRIDAERETT